MEARSITERNRDFFDKGAEQIYTIPWIRDLVSQISGFLSSHHEWLGIRAGEGPKRMISLPLLDCFAATRCIDLSGAMVAQYNANASGRGLSPGRMLAIQGDLLSPDAKENLADDPNWTGFDLIVISMALHHVTDHEAMVAKLAARLNPGGTLAIVDWVSKPEGLSGEEELAMKTHTSHGTITKHGFTRGEMGMYLAKAGLVEYDFTVATKCQMPPEAGGGERLAFAARARRVS
ncbi:NADH-ubiquinone oxidoreductase [Apiospora phragmitis]|uniref:NADH-ubiquinone oxidoreductase n=1 Tax=Apiospora phragmitis TaxID=2905665 RepID=A0ABR1UJF5_9PEZI